MNERARAVIIALAIGILAAIASMSMHHPVRLAGVEVGDIGLPLAGLDMWRHGGSPYDVKLAAHAPALYPFPTLLALWPLTLIPLRFVVAAFAGLTSAALAYGCARGEEQWRLLVFLSPAYWSALQSVQWSPLFAAALLIPSLLPFAIVKPQLGVALVASGRWSLRTAGVTVALLLASVIIWPAWPVEWITHGNLGTFNGRSPLVVLPGVVLLAAAIAWRRSEGRLLLAMSIVVQRYFYDQLPLYLVARNARQMLILLGTSWSGVAVAWAMGWVDPMSGVQLDAVWRIVIASLFLPALGIVLYNERAQRSTLNVES